MKRQLRVKSGVRAPARIILSVPAVMPTAITIVRDHLDGTQTRARYQFPGGLVPMPMCTTEPPCGHCWYCRRGGTP